MVLANGIGRMLPWGHWGSENRKTLALKAGGQAGPLFQLDSRGSGNAIQFLDVGSHIPAPSRSQTRENTYFGPLALLIGKPLCGLPMGYV